MVSLQLHERVGAWSAEQWAGLGESGNLFMGRPWLEALERAA